MAYLNGYNKRIKLTVDSTKIDVNLSYFPVTVFLSSTHGAEVFSELGSNDNRFKIAFTKSDGETQLYAEIEQFDYASLKAIFHVSNTDWTIASATNTDFYLYYDITVADNTTYIGSIDSTPGMNVWDTNFKMVQHMVDATTSTIKDSTNNNNNGTKHAINEPIEATGKIGRGQSFNNNSTDVISVPHNTGLNLGTGNITVETCFKLDVVHTDERGLVSKYPVGTTITPCYILGIKNSKIRFRIRDDTATYVEVAATTVPTLPTLNTGTWYYVAGSRTDTDTVNLQLNDDNFNLTGDIVGDCSNTSDVNIGRFWTTNAIDSTIDEIRISNISRSAAWRKATKNSLWDTLLTYGNEELVAYYYYGYITEDSVPVSRKVNLYNRNTGELINTTTSSGIDGYYYLSTTSSGEHFIVTFDDEIGGDYNALILDKLLPRGIE